MFVVGGDGDFGEHRVFFQFGQLRIAQAAALNPGKTASRRNSAGCSTFCLWRHSARPADADRRSVADIGGNLALQIFFAVGPVIVASAQSSRVISVSGRRAEAEG
jgi:hypothetical protein